MREFVTSFHVKLSAIKKQEAFRQTCGRYSCRYLRVRWCVVVISLLQVHVVFHIAMCLSRYFALTVTRLLSLMVHKEVNFYI